MTQNDIDRIKSRLRDAQKCLNFEYETPFANELLKNYIMDINVLLDEIMVLKSEKCI